MEFPGQGSDLSSILSHSLGNTSSFTHCASPGIEPASQHSQDASSPIVPQQELPEEIIQNGNKYIHCSDIDKEEKLKANIGFNA